MGTLYLTEQNSHLRKTSQRLVVERNGETLLEIPAFKVERVVVFGNVQITTPALVYLLQQGIETTLISAHGKIQGRLTPVENKNVFLRLRQYQTYSDSSFRISFARELIRSKLANGRRFLQRLSYSRELDLTPCLSDIARYMESVQRADSLDSIRGYEGKGTAAYFQAFASLVKYMKFAGRNRRPPRDPVNSLLSFGYTLLAGEVFAALSSGSLDPYLGFFHELKYGRAALCFDLCEEFRHLVVDGLVLDLVNRKRIQEDDFSPDPESGGLLLNPEPRKIFLQAFEQKMLGSRKSGEGDSSSYRMALHGQVEKLRAAIEGKADYRGFQSS